MGTGRPAGRPRKPKEERIPKPVGRPRLDAKIGPEPIIIIDNKVSEIEEKKELGDNLSVTRCWCRACLRFRTPFYFYTSYDNTLDKNGYYSVCRDCIDDIYNNIFLTENSMERTILKLCRMFNLVYNEIGIENLKESLKANESAGKPIKSNIFGVYKQIVGLIRNSGKSMARKSMEEMSFVEPSLDVKAKITDSNFKDVEYYQEQWGIGLSMNEEDYKYLEQEYAKWQKTADCSTQDVEILVREICHTQNKIRKARIAGDSTTALVKELQDIMKNGALTPAMKNVANSGRAMETFGMWVKEIESMEPAEWLESVDENGVSHNMYRDVDDVEGYFQKYFVRPLKNLMLQSKDFNVEDDVDTPEEYDEVDGDV